MDGLDKILKLVLFGFVMLAGLLQIPFTLGMLVKAIVNSEGLGYASINVLISLVFLLGGFFLFRKEWLQIKSK